MSFSLRRMRAKIASVDLELREIRPHLYRYGNNKAMLVALVGYGLASYGHPYRPVVAPCRKTLFPTFSPRVHPYARHLELAGPEIVRKVGRRW